MSATFHAYHLPTAPAEPATGSFQVGDLLCRYPDPTPDLVERLAAELRAAGDTLRERPVAEIVDVLDAAAARLVDPADPLRQEADRLLPAATGYSEAMASLVLERMAADWRADALRGLMEAELGGPAALDGFVRRGASRLTRAYGPRLGFHILSGNVPGVAVTSMVRSVLVKGPVLAKLAAGEPVLPVLFARAVASVDEAIGRAMAVTYWPGGEAGAEAAAMKAADVIVVYGGERVVRSVRERSPAGARVVDHGPKFSAGIITAAALDADDGSLAMALARAAATFDQQGCVSPHAVWIEDPDGSRGDGFAEAVASAFAALERELPRGRIERAEAARIQQERGAAEMRALAGQGGRVLAGPGTSWTVVQSNDPAFRPSCLNRFLHLHPVARVEDAMKALAAAGSHLQSVAVAAPADRRVALADALARAGATRVTSFERLPWPPADWRHDGRGPLHELLRWVDLEG